MPPEEEAAETPKSEAVETAAAPVEAGADSDARVKQLVAQRDALKSKLSARDQADAAEKARLAEEAAIKAGEFEKVIETYKQRISEFEAKDQARDAEERKAKVFAQVKKAAPNASEIDLRGAYLVLSEEHAWEAAPTDVETAAKERVKALQKAKPDLFAEPSKTEERKSFSGNGVQAPTKTGAISFVHDQAAINKALGI